MQHQAETLRARNLEELDIENLIEKIECMGKSEQRALVILRATPKTKLHRCVLPTGCPWTFAQTMDADF